MAQREIATLMKALYNVLCMLIAAKKLGKILLELRILFFELYELLRQKPSPKCTELTEVSFECFNVHFNGFSH